MAASPDTTAPPGRPPLRRTAQGAAIAGICAGAGRTLGVDPLLLRVAAVALVIVTGGLALVGYLVAWGLVPADPDAPPGPESLGWRTAIGAGLLAAAALLALQELGAAPGAGHLAWPALITTAGVVLLWRTVGGGTPAPGPPGAGAAPPGTPTGLPGGGTTGTTALELPSVGARTLAGVALIAVGLVALLEATNAIGTLRDLVVATLVVLAGVTLIFGTSWLGLLSTLRAERAQRIRSDERAEMAAHLHDSVLQTLALIQRRAGDEREVAQLARRQEHELRDWLAGRTGVADGAPATLADALRAAAAEVETLHAVRVEVVTVGDAPLDEPVAAMVRAATEATVNAAKFAGTGRVDVYAEADADRVEIFVRDRGAGFDPEAVPEDRRGVRESIVGRMARHGGRATIRSGPGQGTEVELVLERAGATA